jgi:hypothetical protein
MFVAGTAVLYIQQWFPPDFESTVHPLLPCWHLQKLFQAVEEARALLVEGAAYQQRKQLTAAAAAAADDTQQHTQRPQRSQKPVQQQQKQPGSEAQQAVPAYPPPVREDMSRSSKQLLKWLKAAAADPQVSNAQCRNGVVSQKPHTSKEVVRNWCNATHAQ